MNYLFQMGRRQIIILMVIMGLLSMAFAWSIFAYMYFKQIKQQAVFLSYIANTAKSMIESIINEELNLRHVIIPENVFHHIQYHMKLKKAEANGLGKTGEVVIGYLDGNNIDFIFDLRFSRETRVNRYKKSTLLVAEPMANALSGLSGTMIGLDYRGIKVLAGYEPLPRMNLGIVAKIDLSEIRKPYYQAAIYSFGLVVILFGAAAMIIIRIGERVITINEIREQKYRAYVAYAPVGIILCDKQGKFLEVNDKASEIIGMVREDLLTSSFSTLMLQKMLKVNVGENIINEMVEFFNADQNFINMTGEEYYLMVSVVRLTHERYLCFINDITARKTIENKLFESEKKFRSLFMSAQDAIILADDQAKVVLWNLASEKIFGYRDQEAIGKKISELIIPDKYKKIHEIAYHDFGLTGMGKLLGKNFEITAMNKVGLEFPIEMTLASVILHDKWHAIAIVRDITNRKLAEAELRESESRYRSLFENMLNGYAYCKMIFDNGQAVDFIYIHVNNSFEKLTGLKDVTGKSVSEVIPGLRKSNPEIFEIYGRVSMGGKPEKFESYVDQLGVWFSVTVYCPKEEYFVAIFDNITEQKQLQNEIIQSESKFRTLYESSTDAIMLLDDTGFTDCNARTLHMFGCSTREDFIHKKPTQFSPVTQPNGQFSENLAEEHISVAIKNGSNQFEWQHIRLDGTEFPAEVLLTAMELNGRPVLQATVRDITSRKLMEEQLLQSAKMATLGEMATGIAHEINQPLTVIKMGAQLLERSIRTNHLTNDFLSDQADKFMRNIDRATRIINHLRLFGRKVSDEMVPFNINIPIGNSIEMVDNRLHHALIKLNLELENNLPEVLGEENSMEQVIINILLNAIDALLTMENSYKKEISISSRYDDSVHKVVVKISNNGPEIPKSIINKIFEPFFTTKGPGKGTGLGLSISYGILQSYGGSISAENTEYGPCFTIKLPVKSDDEKNNEIH